ncbi:amino acid adenylation domain-containing protein [Streptomyces griseiscabiei]|uniref:Amino acid adenylation domain-containing protein n=3 Tax=Streptomyces griseiscabiei TaxID=2993540 RepID=A0ABU4L4I9_9ACTN|nr:amino acid adenylation domain-containing protein [Streptomyces griseiscabiei]MBZ3905536.1 amino acid adenylation domain-containing protein [Streptomyces griseiscabiei]MDX2910626.1 amino acid adenylation domain-containing protein [Streptomyces griseiscabiei]
MTASHALLAAQEGIWTGQQLDTASPAYNTAEYVHIHGPVDTSLFEAALRRVVGETEALHVSYAVDGRGRPRETVTPAGGRRPHTADLTTRPDPHAAALAWMDRDMARPVDLTEGPVFGHALLRIAPEEYLWYHRVHHIALDGFGLALVARRVADVYTALVAGRPPGDSGFGTLASVREEERAYRESPRHAEDGAYWAARYADRPPVPTPAGRTALPARTFRRRVADLDAGRTEALRTVARDIGVTWSEILLAVAAARLHRLTGAPEIVLSLPAMGRLGSVALRVPCTVRNILPLRVPVTASDTPRDLAVRVSRELRAGLPHQRYRYERLRRDLGLVGGRRRLSGPGVNIMPFAYDLRFAGHRSTVHNVSAGPVDDLSVNVYDRSEGTGLRIAVDAHPELYAEREVAAFQEGLLALLEEAAAHPDRPLGAAPRPVPPRAGPVTATPAPDVAPASLAVLDGGPLPGTARPVLDLIAAHAARHGGSVAVEHQGRTVTYAQLLASAQEVAHRLTARQVGPGDLVTVALPRGVDAVTAVLGVLSAGAAYSPLDPAAPPARRRALLADTRPALVLTTRAHATGFPGHPVLPLDEPHPRPGPAARPQAPAPDGLAYVMHTSGSTGRPKGVEIGHRALAHFVAGALPRYGIRRGDRVLQFAPLTFDTCVEEVFLTLCAGATLVVRTDDMTESVPGFLDACARLRISVLDLPTAYWHELAHTVSTGTAALPPGVRTVVIGGETALPERVDRWRAAVGPSVRLLNTYGPTEATVVATVADLHDPALAPGDVPIGRPLPGTRAAVVDGELHLLGPHLADGYRGDPGPDAARFAPLDRLPGAPRAYRTGDLARIGADGQLRHLGRSDAEFKISGHRVHPAEVESVLLAHPGVRDTAVVGQVAADGTRRLVAYVVPDGPAPAVSHLRERLRAALPAAMVPSAVEFLDRLPRTASGKTDRNALAVPRERPDRETAAHGSPEATIAAVWRDVLGVAAVSAEDDVFDLGAHSLQAIQVTNRLSAELGRDLKVAWLFQHPTPAELARFLDRAPREGDDPAKPPPAGPALPDTLLADAVLDPAVRIAARPRATTGPPDRILLTGATGFVGAHLLAELLKATGAEIVCPVRAPGPAEAAARVRQALRTHGLSPAAGAGARVTAIPADLARPHLGLDEETFAELARTCGAIVHNAATVSILREYATLRAANTESTRHLVRMAAVRATPLHLVSTLSVAPPLALSPEVPEAFLPPHPGLRYGYQRSKWAAERLVEQAAERGLPVTVHRLGRVVGPASTGYVDQRDFLWSVLRAGVPAGVVPDLFEEEIWTPVDQVARTLVHLCLGRHPAGATVFNHAAGAPVRLADLYDWLEEYGYPLRRVPAHRWRAELPVSSDAAATTLAFLDSWGADAGETGGADLRLGRVRADNVVNGLRGSGITCPPVDRDLVLRYLDHCVTTGALPAPADRRSRAHLPLPAE